MRRRRRLFQGFYQQWLAAWAERLERSNLADYLALLQNPFRLFWLNFFAGLARGFGIAVGLTVIASLFLGFLTYLAKLNLPVIGEFVARLVQVVNQQLRSYS